MRVMLSPLIEAAFRYQAVRWAAGMSFLLLGIAGLWMGRPYSALVALCWVERVSNIEPLRRIARKHVFRMIEAARTQRRNPIVESYLEHPSSQALLATYAVAGGHRDMFRDVMVLKAASHSQKGVILLKYAETFAAVQAAFEVPRLMERYVFVLEPCWAGYCEPSLLMYLSPDQAVFVQCFTADDRRFIEEIGHPLVPLALGPADWVDADLFRPRTDREQAYDLVMVANWARHKRHSRLFQALNEIREREIRVLLIGFPFGGRNAGDIRREAAAIRNPNVTIDIEESLPPAQVAERVSQCKAFVFLSRKEGDNKALVEAMFADVPAIVFAETIGGATSRINEATGVLAEDEHLASSIVYVLDHLDRFQPRAWALRHTGSANASRTLEDALRGEMKRVGIAWEGGLAEKTNSPNLTYKNPEARQQLQADYDFIYGCRRTVALNT